MTIKDLQKIIQEHEPATDSAAMQQLLTKLRDRPFYIWSNDKHNSITQRPSSEFYGRCCFNHVIGLPKKDGKEYPLFDYENIVYKALMQDSYLNNRSPTPEEEEKFRLIKIELENKVNSKKESIKKAQDEYLKQKSNELIYDFKKKLIYDFKKKHCAILKASGLGITELVLRFLVWLCLRDNKLSGSQMIIFTGPRLELALSLMNRIKDFFKPHGITFTDKETVVNLNGVRIEAFPSHHADSARGLPNVSLIFADECSFFPDREKDNVMDIMLRNVPKSNPYLIAVSTPQKPGDLMDQLMSEHYQSSPFKKIYLDWTYGIGKIYDQSDIDKIKNSRSFPREFCLQFSGIEGNVVSQEAIDRCISTGEILERTAPLDDWSIPTKYVMSIDIGWGSDGDLLRLLR